MSEEKPLPAGWYSNYDPQTQKTYYYKADGTTTWEFPTEPDTSEPAPQEQTTTVSEPVSQPPSEPETSQPTVAGSTVMMKPAAAEPSSVSGDTDQAMGAAYTRLLVLPSSSLLYMIVYIIFHVVLAIVELVIGAATAGGTKSARGSLRHPLDENKTSFVAVWMIVDSIVSIIDNLAGVLLCRIFADDLLKNKQNIPGISKLSFIPFTTAQTLFPNNDTHRIVWVTRWIVYSVFFVFRAVWGFIGLIAVSTNLYFKLDEDDGDVHVYTGQFFFAGFFVVGYFFSLAIQLMTFCSYFFFKKAASSA